eukprot:scaffold5649_cov130-Cylindrotheca_fusiformis.AAC.6
MAANIDQQLNESVGVEGSSNLDAPPPPPPPHEADDAWNDDFDFDDDDNIPAASPITNKPIAAAAAVAVVPPKAEQPTTPQTPSQSLKGIQLESSKEESESPTTPAVEPTLAGGDDMADFGEGEEEEMVQHVATPGVPEDGNDNDNEVGEAQEQDEMKDNLPQTPRQSHAAVDDGWNNGNEQNGNVKDSDNEKTPAEQPFPMEVHDSTPLGETPSPGTFETPRTPAALSSLTANMSSVLSRSSVLSEQQQQQQQPPPPKQQTQNVTSLFSSFASAVDSALDSAVDKVPANVVVEEEDAAAGAAAGWDDGAFDFPDDASGEQGAESYHSNQKTSPHQTTADGISSKKAMPEQPNEALAEHNEMMSNHNNVAENHFAPSPGIQQQQQQQSQLNDETKDITSPTVPTTPNMETVDITQDPRYLKLQQELQLRERQLTNKAEQLGQLQDMWENQEQELRQKIQDTKEEAKKRIAKARERCEAAEARLKQSATHGAQSSAQQDQLIADLRSEGEALARKQSQMEQTVRAAHGEIRELKAQLADEIAAKDKANGKIVKLEAELKDTKDSLKAARKGESQAGQLENDLLAARSESEMKSTTILSLQQQVKELTAEGVELKEEIEKTRKSAAQEAQQAKKSMRREHNDVISDLEAKLRTTEREAGVREDALRHEVTELRKRWEDAVRRADALSMDVQSSTSPLLRQLESMERQNRARAAAWAELENRLRSDLEEAVIQNESLSRERSEFKTKCTRLERSANEGQSELKEYRRTIEDQTAKISKLESQLEKLVEEAEKRQEEYVKVERLANEGIMRVRSEMTQTVVDSEERYRGQIEKLEAELRVEKEKRSQLEGQVEQLLDNTGMIMPPQAPHSARSESKPKKLRNAEGQAEILAGALGLDDSDDETDDEMIGMSMDRGEGGNSNGGMGSFAALEQLTSRLKAAQVELQALRKNLRESEKSRESLVEELAESRNAKEKLPLFEEKVRTLTEENREMELEIRGLRDDIADVRELYRTQLNVLLEEKTSKHPQANGQPIPQAEASDTLAESMQPEQED